MPHVGDAVTSLCEQVPIGRATTSNRTACQPTLGKKLSLQLRKNRTACLIKSHSDGDWSSCTTQDASSPRKVLRHQEGVGLGHKAAGGRSRGFGHT